MSIDVRVPTIDTLLAHERQNEPVFAPGSVVLELDEHNGRTVRFNSQGLWVRELLPSSVLDSEMFRVLARAAIVYMLREDKDVYDVELAFTPHASGYLRMHNTISRSARVLVLCLDPTKYRSESECTDVLQRIYVDHWWDPEINRAEDETLSLGQLAKHAFRLLGFNTDDDRRVRNLPRAIIHTAGVSNDVETALLSSEVIQKLRPVPRVVPEPQVVVGETETQKDMGPVGEVSDLSAGLSGSARTVVKPSDMPTKVAARTLPELAKPKLPNERLQSRASLLYGFEFDPNGTPPTYSEIAEPAVLTTVGLRIGRYSLPEALPRAGELRISPACTGYFVENGILLVPGALGNNAKNTNAATREVRQFQDALVNDGLISRSPRHFQVIKPLLFKNPNVAATLIAGVVTPLTDLKEIIG